MDIDELRKDAHLSASSISAYIECGLLYKLSRLDKLEPESTSDALELGSTIHQALADFNQLRMQGEMQSLEELHANFEQYWRQAAEECDDIDYQEGKDFDLLLKEGKGLLTVYHNSLTGDEFKVIAIEQSFRFIIEGIAVPIIGFIDLIEVDPSGAIIIVDYKTASRAYSADQVDRNFQMTLYQMAAKAMGYHDREILLRLDCLIKTKKPRFEQFYTTRNYLDERRAIKKIAEVWKGISREIFIPNDLSWRCNGCGYKTYCDAWFEAD